MFIILNYPHAIRCKQRDRKPSRLPLRTLNRLEKKSKKLTDIDTNRQKHFLTAKTATANTDFVAVLLSANWQTLLRDVPYLFMSTKFISIREARVHAVMRPVLTLVKKLSNESHAHLH